VLLEALSGLVALLCALASVRRLAVAVAPLRLDLELLIEALEADRGGELPARLREATAGDSELGLEHALLTAFAVEDAGAREALVSEELGEIQARSQQLARVPRVCASVASSSGFLLASVALIQAMDAFDAMGPEESASHAHATLATALGTLALGIAGASFCAAVYMRARRVRRARMSALTRLVDSDLLAKHSNS
jgi:hypothetical protein